MTYCLIIHLANHQIAEEMNMPLSSVCARIRELQVEGKIIDSGKRTMSKYNRECGLEKKLEILINNIKKYLTPDPLKTEYGSKV